MTNVNITLPTTFEDAYEAVKHAFSTGKQIVEGPFSSKYARQVSKVISFNVIDDKEQEKYGNVTVTFTYNVPVILEGGAFREIERTRTLHLFNTSGDHRWTPRTKLKIWDNKYPSTVGVDVETREVFLFGVQASAIELAYFATLTEDQFSQIKEDISDRDPFSIQIDSDAMFDYIDEMQGLLHLQNNLYIQFNCGVSLRVDMERAGVLELD